MAATSKKPRKRVNPQMAYWIENAKVITPYRVIPNGIVAVRGGIIDAAGERDGDGDPADRKIIDAGGLYAAPGFIDLHVHGGGGYEFNLADPDTIRRICSAHAAFGTTSIVPTTLAAPVTELKETIHAVKAAQSITSECNILGIHLEGPFFAQSQRGAQNPEHIILPDREIYMDLLEQWEGILMMGAAPELPGGLELGRELRRRGIAASIAHSDATYDEVAAAAANGYSDVTHIYSGCSTVRRRNGYRYGGVVEAGLAMDDLTVQVIADGKHLPAELLKLIYKCKGADRISLITDALFAAASGYADGDVLVQKNGMRTVLEDGVMKLMDRQAFAGSVATANTLVRNMVELAGAGVADAVRMASLTPAKVLGVDHRKGKLVAGYDADLVLFDERMDVKLTMVGGNIIYGGAERKL